MTPFPRFLPKLRPASLCQLAGRWGGKVPDGGIACEEKRDGWRALWFPGIDGKPGLWTRQGQAIEGAAHIAHWLSIMEHVAGVPMMFDGEFQVDGTLAATKQWCERGWRTGGNAGRLYLFDAVPLADWQAGHCETRWIDRKAHLADIMRRALASPLAWEWAPGTRGKHEGALPVEILPDTWLFTADDVRDEARRVWASGGEGLMLKDPEAPYTRSRSDAWLKVKQDGAA